MADAYTQIFIHVVMAVKSRQCLILPEWEERLYQYITGIVREKGHKMLAINGMPDHLHFLIGMKPMISLSALVQEIKKSSNGFINSNHLSETRFSWQKGYGAFSYSTSVYPRVINYIERQKIHHEKHRFREEYVDILKKFRVEFNEKYLFSWIE